MSLTRHHTQPLFVLTILALAAACWLGAASLVTAQQSPPCVSAPANLAAWYRGEGDAADVTGVNNGALGDGATFAPGKVGQAFSLDGVNDFVEVPDHPSLTPASLSLDAWVNPDTLVAERPIVSKYNSSTANGVRWVLLTVPNTGRLSFVVYQSLSPAVYRGVETVNSALTVGEWRHVAATFDAATQSLKIYADGAEVPTTLIPGSASAITAIADSGVPVGACPPDAWLAAVSFSEPVASKAAPRQFSIAAADFNLDGKSDLAAANGDDPAGVSIYLNDGTGPFPDWMPANRIPIGNADFVYPADINADGKPDLFVTRTRQINNPTGTVTVAPLVGHGDGTFSQLADGVVARISEPYLQARCLFRNLVAVGHPEVRHPVQDGAFE